VLLLGATGTIGRATAAALLRRGHTVVGLVRRPPTGSDQAGAEWRLGEATDPASLARDGFRGERFDALVSCLASRTGEPRDAWAVDHAVHQNALAQARQAGVRHFVLLSAICVQRPQLAFQHAKLAFEQELVSSGMRYSIVRPTAYFKSLAGQIERVRRGKPFLVFGDGRLTACKPISDRDLGDYLADCLTDPERHNRILPIGGPGPALTPLDQARMLFELMGEPARIRQVPVRLLDVIVGTLSTLGGVWPALTSKAELARIGRYYATESMLVWNTSAARYDADATPSTGSDTLRAFYADVLQGRATVERREHAVF
jgi:divinyl chlorophyllide a 8-vinyl-reductase